MTAQKEILLRGILHHSRLSNPVSRIMARLAKPDYIKPILLRVTLMVMPLKSRTGRAIRALRRFFENPSFNKTSNENACLTLDPKICFENESRDGAIFPQASSRGNASLFLLPTSFDFPRFSLGFSKPTAGSLRRPSPCCSSNAVFSS